ncbi:MAG: KH domain-containing protein [Patescibacteria group bacterium]|jgi:hypothetical protein|nr:KH domain-containing protein [Patescibacteria group bacterium]
MTQVQDKEFVEYIVKAIVNNPKDVVVDRTVDEMGVLLSLKVNPEDMGQVIGRSGQVARSLRTLIRIIGAKNNARVNLKIEEPEGSQRAVKPATEEKVDSVDDLKL